MADTPISRNQEGDDYNERLQMMLAAEEAAAQRRAANTPEESTHTYDRAAPGTVRISNMMALFMLIAAVFFDGVQFFLNILGMIPLFGIIFTGLLHAVAFSAWVAFGFWFAALKVNYFGGRKAAMKIYAIFATLVIGLIPILSMVPELTAGVLVMIIATRAEDTSGGKNQLLRIAKRRVRDRSALGIMNDRRLRKASEKDARRGTTGKKNSAAAQTERKNSSRMKRYDNRIKRENMGMIARATLGVPKKPVDGIKRNGQYSEGERRRQLSTPGYYDPQEEYPVDEFSPDDYIERPESERTQ